jgi:hypothetical protein
MSEYKFPRISGPEKTLEIAGFPELTSRKLAAKDWQRAKLAAMRDWQRAKLAAMQVPVLLQKLRKLVSPSFFEFLSPKKAVVFPKTYLEKL